MRVDLVVKRLPIGCDCHLVHAFASRSSGFGQTEMARSRDEVRWSRSQPDVQAGPPTRA
jgi:hypothetical protein